MNKRPLCAGIVCFLFGIFSCLFHPFWMGVSIICIVMFSGNEFITYGKKYQKQAMVYLMVLFLYTFAGIARTSWVLESRESILQTCEEGKTVSFEGKLKKKEIKNESVIYYIERNHFLCITEQSMDQFSIGSRVKIKGIVSEFPSAANEGNFDQNRYYKSQGILFRLKDPVIEEEKKPLFPVGEWLFWLLKQMRLILEGTLPGEEGGIMAAICLGSKGGLDPEVKQLFQTSGLAHILAVSGLHVSVVGMGIHRFLRKNGSTVIFSSLVSAVLILLYGSMCGNTVSTIRAVGMFLLMILATVLGEAYDPLSALSFMAFFLLWKNPLYIINSGFLLSFSAVLGIFLVADPLHTLYMEYCRIKWEKTHRKDEGRSFKPSVIEAFLGQLLFSYGMQLFSMPILLSLFYSISPYVIVLNLIVLPFVGLLLFAGLSGALLGVLLPGIPILKNLLLYPCHMILYFYEFLMDHSLRFPFAKLCPGVPGIPKLIMYEGILFLMLYFLFRFGKRKLKESSLLEETRGRSAVVITKHERKLLYAGVMTILCLPILLLLHGKHPFSVTMLDVGQGDGLVITDGANRTYMIDGGSSSVTSVGTYRIEPYLKYHGISKIDVWFISHTDQDHISGLVELLEEGFPVETVVFAEAVEKNEHFEMLQELIRKSDCNIRFAKEGERYGNAECYFQVLYPGEEAVFSGANENSLSLLLRRGSFTGVFAGDIGTEQEEYILERLDGLEGNTLSKLDGSEGSTQLNSETLAEHTIASRGETVENTGTNQIVVDEHMNPGMKAGQHGVTLLKATHHGSNKSNCEKWLRTLSPELCIISAGKNNSYGHPGKETLSRLDELGIKHLCTIDTGQITILSKKDGGYEVEKFHP